MSIHIGDDEQTYKKLTSGKIKITLKQTHKNTDQTCFSKLFQIQDKTRHVTSKIRTWDNYSHIMKQCHMENI
jgi:hypothetical protein